MGVEAPRAEAGNATNGTPQKGDGQRAKRPSYTQPRGSGATPTILRHFPVFQPSFDASGAARQRASRLYSLAHRKGWVVSHHRPYSYEHGPAVPAYAVHLVQTGATAEGESGWAHKEFRCVRGVSERLRKGTCEGSLCGRLSVISNALSVPSLGPISALLQ